MSTEVKQKSGRRYTVDASGISSLKRDYIVIQDATMGADGEVAAWTGVPAVGSAHPNYPGLVVQSLEVQEGQSEDKSVLTVTANYGLAETETITPSGEGEEPYSFQVDEWGWDDGTDERELLEDVDGQPMLNSAGDPFESVPKFTVPAPVFTKVVKFAARKADWYTANCKVNSSAVTIGGRSFPIGSLLCTVAEKRLIGNAIWNYQYTIRLRYKSNLVKIAGSSSLTDIGWDIAVTDAGMREYDIVNDKMRLIRVQDAETGKMCTVTSAALLDGQGAPLSPGSAPYNFRFKAYERTSFPAWFYSEPQIAQGDDD